MACNIERPNPQALFEQYRNMFSANVLGGAPVVPESNEWYATALSYAMAEEFYAISEQQWKERDPKHACCDNLIKLAAADGVYPEPAKFAGGYAIIYGVAGSTTPSPLRILASNDQTYAAVGSIPALIPSSGFITVQIQAVTAGAAGNAAGDVTTGTLVTINPGIEENVVICGGQLCGGKPAESCEQFRTRYIARKQYAPRATQAWAMQKLLEWPCATRVIPRGGECCACDGTNDCNCQTCGAGLSFYVLFDGAFPCGVAPANIIENIAVWMFGETPGYGQGQMEIGVCGSIFTPTPFYVDVSIDIEGCATPSQVTKIQDQITDLFTTISPSVPFRTKQIDLIVAGIVGASVNIATTLTPQVVDPAAYTQNACGDIEPNCDYLPCLGGISFTNPSNAQVGC